MALLRGLALLALTSSSLANPIAGYATTYEVLTEGAGRAVSKGSQVTVHATGIVEESSFQFWSTKDAGQQPFSPIGEPVGRLADHFDGYVVLTNVLVTCNNKSGRLTAIPVFGCV